MSILAKKQQLENEIKELEDQFTDADTPQNIKDLLKGPLENARKQLTDLEELEKKEKSSNPAPAAVVKKEEQQTTKIISATKKVVKKVKAAVNKKPSTAGGKKSLKAIVKANKELAAIYGGKTEKELKSDAGKKAMRPGSRTSASGKEYREYRGNRSDISGRSPYLAKGGNVVSSRKSGWTNDKTIFIKTMEDVNGIDDARRIANQEKSIKVGDQVAVIANGISYKFTKEKNELVFNGRIMSDISFAKGGQPGNIRQSSNIYVVKKDNSAFEIKKGDEIKVYKNYFRNGETHFIGIMNGKSVDLPSVFFEKKNFAQGGQASNSIEVRSSNGNFTVNSKTGNIIHFDFDEESGDPGYKNIDRFDLEEWKKHHGKDELDESIDILDLGYWMKNGTYEEPAEDWREMMKKRKKKSFARGGDIGSKKDQIRQWMRQNFPVAKNTGWENATDELPDLHQHMAELYNENDPVQKYEFNFSKRHNDPAERNRVHREGVEKLLKLMSPSQIESIYEHYGWFKNYAKGGQITVWSIADIPDLQRKVDAGKVTYRGLGLGKLSNDFFKLTGEEGRRIKVEGKEYFITESDYKKLNWDDENKKWRGKIKFDAPFKNHYNFGGELTDEAYPNFPIIIDPGTESEVHTTLDEFVDANQELPDEEMDRVKTLEPGGETYIGGGAAAEFKITRPATMQKGGQAGEKYRAEVAATGENRWSNNSMEYDTPEEAKQWLDGLSGRWFGYNLSRVVPVSTPYNQPVDMGNDELYQNYRKSYAYAKGGSVAREDLTEIKKFTDAFLEKSRFAKQFGKDAIRKEAFSENEIIDYGDWSYGQTYFPIYLATRPEPESYSSLDGKPERINIFLQTEMNKGGVGDGKKPDIARTYSISFEVTGRRKRARGGSVLKKFYGYARSIDEVIEKFNDWYLHGISNGFDAFGTEIKETKYADGGQLNDNEMEVAGIKHTKIRDEIPYRVMTGYGAVHPLGDVYAQGKYGYVANGYDWYQFELKDLPALTGARHSGKYAAAGVLMIDKNADQPWERPFDSQEAFISHAQAMASKAGYNKPNDFAEAKELMQRLGYDIENYADGGHLGDDPVWHHVGLNRPPANFTPAAAAAFKKAIGLLESEKPADDKPNQYYDTARAAMNTLITKVSAILSLDDTGDAARAHELLQEIGIYNYKTGLLLDTSWLNETLATRKLAEGGFLEKGGAINEKTWIINIAMPAEKGTTLRKEKIILGKKSDEFDVKQAIKRKGQDWLGNGMVLSIVEEGELAQGGAIGNIPAEKQVLAYKRGGAIKTDTGEQLYTKDELLKKYKGKFIDTYPHHYAYRDPETHRYETVYEVRGVASKIKENFQTPEEVVYKAGGDLSTLSDLKRKLQKGQGVKMVNYFGLTEADPKKPGSSKLSVTRYVVKVQTNGVYLSPDKNASTGSYWEFPAASLVEVSSKGFKVFGIGERPLNEDEKNIIANQPKDDEQDHIDAMSDGSTMYYRRKNYFEKSGYAYLYSGHWQKGLYFNSNKNVVMDKSIRGPLELQYEFVDEFAGGGRPKSALMRDRKYQSQEPWEQTYQRSSRPRHPHYAYADGGKVRTYVADEFTTDDKKYYPGYHVPSERWNVWPIDSEGNEIKYKSGGQIKTFADLKRKLQKGQGLKMVNYFGLTEPDPKKPGSSKLGVTRYVVKTQTNGVYLSPDKNATTGSYWEFPPASLVEVSDKGFKVYGIGERPLNEKEKEVIANQPKDDKQDWEDAMTDGSTMYYRRKSYFQNSGYGYLYNSEWQKGLYFNNRNNTIMDKSIRGPLELEYEFVDEFSGGGRPKSALMRDRKYQSQQPWEQAYQRSSRPRHPHYAYADGGKVRTYVADEFTTDDKKYYPGYHVPSERWNGWATPLFEKDTAIQILKDFGYPHEIHGPNIEFDPNWYSDQPEEEKEMAVQVPIEISVNGKKKIVYSIGSYYWVWDEKNKDEFAEGGPIPNNYAGKTAEQVWDGWTEEQREHFLNDHGTRKFKGHAIKIWATKKYADFGNNKFDMLGHQIKESLEDHISEGQYAKGGQTHPAGIANKHKLTQQLAKEFSRILRRDLSAEEMKAIVAENKKTDDDTCATHDYLDANMSMDEAFTNIMGRQFVFFDDDKPETEKQNEEDAAIFNAAWNLAKMNDFYPNEKFANGGLSRDRKFKSQEPHEQAYKRKKDPKNPVYKKKNTPSVKKVVKKYAKK